MELDMGNLARVGLYLGIPFILAIFFLQYKWAKDCDKYVRVLVAMQSGGGRYYMAPKSGGEITIENPETKTVRTWPLNELATIEVLYPGLGFIPGFMQKTIKMAIVSEGDWEPMLNRSAHLTKIASPDVVKLLRIIAEASQEESTKSAIEEVVGDVSTSPTREMIADPASLGAIMRSSVLKELATISKEVVDSLQSVIKKLGNIVNPTVVYIGLGLNVILVVYLVFQIVNLVAVQTQMLESQELIKKILGVP